MAEKLKFAVCGYGGSFHMGRRHATWLQEAGPAELVAVCDPDAERQAAAQEEFPGIETYDDLETLLAESDAELVFIVTPHNLHAPQAMTCLRAGRHVVLEKPMCLSTIEADEMIALASENDRMVTVFHNRRWDGDYLAIKNVIEKGQIGEVFSVRGQQTRFGMRTDWWRASKVISGGTMYDWGVHITDWVLGIVPSKIVNVTGFSHKRVWHDADVEDEVWAIIRFENGAVGEVLLSHIRNLRQQRKWEIMGTEGNITFDWRARNLEVTTHQDNRLITEYVPTESTDYSPFYKGVLACVLEGGDPPVAPESAARAIAVIEAQMKSAETGQPVEIPGE
ncbi:MAG: Gfo/Idh/MocA family protein [Planctomycetota bacterium]